VATVSGDELGELDTISGDELGEVGIVSWEWGTPFQERC
jgi:hypothetical protein